MPVSYKARVDVVSVIAGTILTLAAMFFCMSLAAALGYWNYQPDEPRMLGPKFWTIASEAWTVSVFLGAVVATLSARAKSITDGILNALITWAASYLVFGGIARSIVQTNFNNLLDVPSVGLFWHGFYGDASALLGSIAGGFIGAVIERGITFSGAFRKKENLTRSTAVSL